MKSIIVSFLFLLNTLMLHAYESEDKLKTVIVGKIAKYISWNEHTSDYFVITVLNNQFGSMFDEVYRNRSIKNRPVKIQYITNIEDMNSSDILFISQKNLHDIDEILLKTKGLNILTVSDLRGFAQKGGSVQLYFLGRNLKIIINIDAMKEKHFRVNNRLIRVSEILKGEDDDK